MDYVSYGFNERSRCPTCNAFGETIWSVLYSDPRVRHFIESYYEGRVPIENWTELRYHIERCNHCGLLWQRWVPDEQNTQSLYESWISSQDSLKKKMSPDISLFSLYAREMEAIATLTKANESKTAVLDFGMGWGYWCRMANAYGYRSWGYDISAERINHALGMGVNAVRNLHEIRRRSFDFINCEQVLEHIPDPKGTLRLLADCLRPEGTIRVSVPDGQFYAQKFADPHWRAAKDALQPLEHVNCFSHQALRNLGMASGLDWLSNGNQISRNNGTCLHFRKQKGSPKESFPRIPLPVVERHPIINRHVSCIVRTIGERTTSACRHLIAIETNADKNDILIVGGKPFSHTLVDSLRAGTELGREWTLCIDADVLPFTGAIAGLLKIAESFDDNIAEVQGVVFDRFFGGWRPAGVHLYRSCHIPRALEMIPFVSNEIRPETSLLYRLREDGLQWKQIGLGFGLHDFEQHPHDIYRKCFVHAWKHTDLIPRMLTYWRMRSGESDFRAALQGLAAGIAHHGDVTVDWKADYFTSELERHDDLTCDSISIDIVRNMIQDEEAQIRSLGYTQSPVWDWVDHYWSDNMRKQALNNCLSQIVEAGIRSCETCGGSNIANRQLDLALSDWGIHSTDPTPLLVSWNTDDTLSLKHIDGRRETIFPQITDPMPRNYQLASVRLSQRLIEESIREVLIYGAGEVGQTIHRQLSRQGIYVLAFLETDPQPEKLFDSGHIVLSAKEGLRKYPGLDVVIASFGSAYIMTRNVLGADEDFSRHIWVIR